MVNLLSTQEKKLLAAHRRRTLTYATNRLSLLPYLPINTCRVPFIRLADRCPKKLFRKYAVLPSTTGPIALLNTHKNILR